MKWISGLIALGAVVSANATTIAVIDSGLDYKHEKIAPNLWTNPLEVEDNRDNDNNGYQDDVHGWNFAEQNGKIIDYSYLGKFSPDCKKYFDVQGKIFLKQATEEEIAWIKGKQADPKFIAEMGKFGNFVHGTHVSGIAVENSNGQTMGIKLIPTEIKPFFDGLSRKSHMDANIDRWEILAQGFTALAQQQMTLLSEIGRFVHEHKADVANGSFGTGFNQAKIITDNAFKILFFRKPTEEESKKAAALFINALVSEGSKFVGAAPDTLFVFAAGNDGLSNDEFGTSPANIRADNVITVGATYKNEFFAPFSNYGMKVDIAAPGMLIKSAIPGNDYLQVSGTSQASPYVANVAAKVREANPKLTPAEVKKILVGTVDKKAFLVGKVASAGIVNSERAIVGANLSKTMTLEQAIARSFSMVQSAPIVKSQVRAEVIAPIALPPMFK